MSLFGKNIYSHLSKTKTPESVILWLKDNKNKHKPERHILIKVTNILSQIVSHKDKNLIATLFANTTENECQRILLLGAISKHAVLSFRERSDIM
jgi:hypothetical protein